MCNSIHQRTLLDFILNDTPANMFLITRNMAMFMYFINLTHDATNMMLSCMRRTN
jgi:hypothetical protein